VTIITYGCNNCLYAGHLYIAQDTVWLWYAVCSINRPILGVIARRCPNRLTKDG